MAKETLTEAKRNKNDEFYTQYQDIQKEVNAYIDYDSNVFRNKIILLPCDDPEWSNFTKFFAQNFDKFGIKKLISTSFCSKANQNNFNTTNFELNSPQYDPVKSKSKGKIFTLCKDKGEEQKININDLKWEYLDGDGDFRSDEVTRLRDEADIIITNPPFSLFREFLSWIINADKKFLIIGSVNAISYKDTFDLIKNNKIWLGNGFQKGNAFFKVLHKTNYVDGVFDEKTGLVKFRNCHWFTNLEHGRRHQFLKLMSMDDNLKYNKRLRRKIFEFGSDTYIKYFNYEAIEVPFTEAIPNDFAGIMGVPITFLDKYNPDQFEILGMGHGGVALHLPKF